MTAVSGVFHTSDAVKRAVERLVEKSVPTDEITVTVMDSEGRPVRDVPVEDESGVLHGALVGAGLGATLGLVAAVVAVGVYAGWSELATGTGFSWLIRGAGIGFVGGVPLGGILGMGRWRRKDELTLEDLDGRSVVVEVRSDELSGLARRILDDAGAEPVTTEG